MSESSGPDASYRPRKSAKTGTRVYASVRTHDKSVFSQTSVTLKDLLRSTPFAKANQAEREKGERVWAVPAYQHQCQGDEANCVGDAVWGSVYSLGKHYKAQHPHSHGKLNTAICLIWAVVDDDKDDNQQLTFCKQSEQPTLSQLEHILDSQQAAFESSDTISIGEEAPACANALDSGSISDESEIEIETGLDVDYQRSMQDRVQFLTRANLSTKRTLQQRRQLVAQADEDIVTLKARCEQMRRIRAEHLQEICYLENTLQMGTKDLADATERLLQVKSM